jgi:hypothetical protein
MNVTECIHAVGFLIKESRIAIKHYIILAESTIASQFTYLLIPYLYEFEYICIYNFNLGSFLRIADLGNQTKKKEKEDFHAVKIAYKAE